VRQKISPMLCFVFFSLVLFFVTGMVWPQESMPRFWYHFSYLFPSTPGVQGYVKLSSMGAPLSEVRTEYMALWFQAAFYFVTATLVLSIQTFVRRRQNILTHNLRRVRQEGVAALTDSPLAASFRSNRKDNNNTNTDTL